MIALKELDLKNPVFDNQTKNFTFNLKSDPSIVYTVFNQYNGTAILKSSIMPLGTNRPIIHTHAKINEFLNNSDTAIVLGYLESVSVTEPTYVPVTSEIPMIFTDYSKPFTFSFERENYSIHYRIEFNQCAGGSAIISWRSFGITVRLAFDYHSLPLLLKDATMIDMVY